MLVVLGLKNNKSSSNCKPLKSASLTEAVRHIDVVHTSLAGMTGIVLMLLFALALPVFGFHAVTMPIAFVVMVISSFIGIIGLYVLNFRVHKDVTDQARITEVLVNSLGQGFLFFERDGTCGSVYSQACIDLLEVVPCGKKIYDILNIPKESQSDFMDWIDVLYQSDHALSFEDVVRFLPSFFEHKEQRRIALVYRPILDESGKLLRIVLIATDQTEEYAAKQMAKRQQNFAEMICRIYKDRNQFQSTLAHIRDFIELAERKDNSLENSSNILREIHTLKASVKQFNLLEFGELFHKSETELRDPELNSDDEYRLRLENVHSQVKDALRGVTEEVSELIGTEYEWRGNVREIGEDDIYDFARIMKAENVKEDIIEKYLSSIVAVPIRECFYSFEREIRELAAMMDKQVKPILFKGKNPHVLTKSIQEFLFSLTHICRNIVDHGIEPPVTRMARGKDAAGLVTISCDLIDDDKDKKKKWLNISISDDGNGIDPSRVRAKLYNIDPEGDWRFEDDRTVIQRVFSWDFTTKDEVTDLSGRGVGMEAVDLCVKNLGGTISVESQLYKGTTFNLKVPYEMDISKINLDDVKKSE